MNIIEKLDFLIKQVESLNITPIYESYIWNSDDMEDELMDIREDMVDLMSKL